jgi:hypothetical protein
MYFMVTGSLPFKGKTRDEVGKQVQKTKYILPPHVSPDVEPQQTTANSQPHTEAQAGPQSGTHRINTNLPVSTDLSK